MEEDLGLSSVSPWEVVFTSLGFSSICKIGLSASAFLQILKEIKGDLYMHLKCSINEVVSLILSKSMSCDDENVVYLCHPMW